MAAAKEQVYADLDATAVDAMSRSLAMMDVSFDGPDLAEALAARAAKRRPQFGPLS
jgi:enoyl-CoA hydratase/carnithine racemase